MIRQPKKLTNQTRKENQKMPEITVEKITEIDELITDLKLYVSTLHAEKIKQTIYLEKIYNQMSNCFKIIKEHEMEISILKNIVKELNDSITKK